VGERGWQGLLVVIAICSLTLSVATRFWVPGTSQSPIVKSLDRRAAEPARQHLDRDAIQWVAPVANFSIVEPAAVEASLVPAGPPLPRLVFSDSESNRPPPSGSLS